MSVPTAWGEHPGMIASHHGVTGSKQPGKALKVLQEPMALEAKPG